MSSASSRFVLAILALSLLTACARSTTPAPAQRISVPAGATPGATATAALTSICSDAFAGKGSPGAFAIALRDLAIHAPGGEIDQAIRDLPDSAHCFRYAPSPSSVSPLIIATLIPADGDSAILWREGSVWKGVAGPPLGEYAEILSDRSPSSGREVIVVGRYSGTGGIGTLAVLTQKGSEWTSQILVDRVSHFRIQLLSTDALLVTGRQLKGEPLAWDANCCQPSNYQWLLQRRDGRFALTAERVAPDPYYTLNVFFGALRDRRTDWLNQLALPAAVDSALTLGLGQPGVLFDTPETNEQFGQAVEQELRDWDALPIAVRGTAPAQARLTAVVRVASGPLRGVTVTLRRQDGKWMVESLSKLQP